MGFSDMWPKGLSKRGASTSTLASEASLDGFSALRNADKFDKTSPRGCVSECSPTSLQIDRRPDDATRPVSSEQAFSDCSSPSSFMSPTSPAASRCLDSEAKDN